MAITDVPAFTHLTDADIESLAVELDAIRQDIEDSRGERDARYIRRTIAAQRALEVAGRVMLAASSKRSAWWAGTVTLGVAKIIENMEIGHNVMHGQWNWMNDPEIHSSTGSGTWVGRRSTGDSPTTSCTTSTPTSSAWTTTSATRIAARHPRPALEALQPRQPAVQHHPRARVRVGNRLAAPGTGQGLQGSRRPHGHPGTDTRVRRQGRPVRWSRTMSLTRR